MGKIKFEFLCAFLSIAVVLFISGCTLLGSPEGVAADFMNKALKGDEKEALKLVVGRDLKPLPENEQFLPNLAGNLLSGIIGAFVDKNNIVVEPAKEDTKTKMDNSTLTALGASDGYTVRLRIYLKDNDAFAVYYQINVVATQSGWKVLKFW